MKFTKIFLISVLVFCFSACSTTCPCRRGGSPGNNPLPVRYLDLPVIEARTADDPFKTVFLSLSMGYYSESVGAELMRQQNASVGAVRASVIKYHSAELNSVEGYERLRSDIAGHINRMLVSGRVESIIIRNISVR